MLAGCVATMLHPSSGHASGHVFREDGCFEKELCASLDALTGAAAAAAWRRGPIQMLKTGQA